MGKPMGFPAIKFMTTKQMSLNLVFRLGVMLNTTEN